MHAGLDHGVLERLGTVAAEAPVLSVYLRTDPRDPENTRAAPAWRSELTTGLNEIAEELERTGDRDSRLAFRTVHERVLDQIGALDGPALGRSLVWFLSLDGALDERYTARLPLRGSLVRLDARPFVSPGVDLVERGAPAGVVLAGHDRVRVLEWAHGWIDEAADLELEIDRSDWRRYKGSAGSARHRPTVAHTEHVAARELAHRERFMTEAAAAVAQRIERSGWERVLLVAVGGLAPRFQLALPAPARERVRLTLDLNLLGLPAAEIAARVEPHLAALHRHDALELAAALRDAAGPADVLAALASRQVAELLIDPLHRPDVSALPPPAQAVLGGAGADYAGERAVEAALASGADVTVIGVQEADALAAADGMLARLRW
jgi:hypothetical protein